MNLIENESETKLRGGYYTEPDIALFLARWVVGNKPTRLLEPSCGDGVFFEALSKLEHPGLKEVLAFEIEPSEVEKAKQRAALLKRVNVVVEPRDFLKWALFQMRDQQTLDGALGNPPYIRYQYLDSDLQGIAEEISKYHMLPFTKHTNAWVPFVIASVSLLRAGGRIGMVLPAELLHVLHAQSLRTFLAKECDRILLIDPTELWFDNVLQGAVLLLAEKKEDRRSHSKGIAIVQTRTREFLSRDPAVLFGNASYLNGGSIEGKWMKALLDAKERELLIELTQNSEVVRFVDIAEVDVGIVTGANKFFLVPDDIVQKYCLQRWAHPMFGRSEHVNGVIYSKRSHATNRRLGLPTNFIWFRNEPFDKLPRLAREYIALGERDHLDTRYKCRVRSPWYSVPSVYASPVGMLKRSHDFPRLILNTAMAFTTDTAYRIKPKQVSRERLVYSFINSLTVLSAELEGRHYGGGVLELVPSEIERLLIPFPRKVKISLAGLDNAIKRHIEPEKLLEAQDQVLLRGIGLSSSEIEMLRGAWNKLRQRRHRNQTDAAGD